MLGGPCRRKEGRRVKERRRSQRGLVAVQGPKAAATISLRTGPTCQHLGSDGSRDPCVASQAANPRPARSTTHFSHAARCNSRATLQRLSQQEPHSSTLGYEARISASPCYLDASHPSHLMRAISYSWAMLRAAQAVPLRGAAP